MLLTFSRICLVIGLLCGAGMGVRAQQSAVPNAPPPAAPVNAPPSASVRGDAPQVFSVIHRLNGIKVLNMLRRRGAKLGPLSDEGWMMDDMHTTITGGLSLGDGRLVARLPQAEVETTATASETAAPATSSPTPKAPDRASDLMVLGREGGQLTALYLGLDGGTGLSLLQVDGISPSPPRDAKEENLLMGQRVRLISPARAPQVSGVTTDKLLVRLDETFGTVTDITRAASGNVTSLLVRVSQLSPEMVGAVVLNDAGETIGMVDLSGETEAQVIPVAAIRRAALRVSLRLENRPQPWLGARGEAIAATSIQRLMFAGWKRTEADRLISKRAGVLLTVVPAETPASLANLRAGDVVLRVNQGDVKSAEDFSTLLREAGGGVPVRFTVLRPDRIRPRVMVVTLSETLNPVREMETAETRATRRASKDPLQTRGLETIALTPKLAEYFKAQGGLLVISVHPESAASRAGMLAGDVIEAINGKALTQDTQTANLSGDVWLDIVRDGQRARVKLNSAEMTGQ